jgi:hypothetical protein
LRNEFVIRLGQPFEENGSKVKMEDMEQHFANLGEIEISRISPHRIIHLDETGFGASK